jgi:hypothetical protein
MICATLLTPCGSVDDMDNSPGTGHPGAALPDAPQRAAALLSQIAAGDWSQARASFSAAMEALDAERLATAWTGVTVSSGQYLGQGEPVVRQIGALTAVTVPLKFDDATMYGQVAFDAHGKVAGLHFLQEDPDTGKGEELPAHMILRCSDGHLYTITHDDLLWRSVHIGVTQFRWCPVDHKWRKANFVDPNTLTREELEETRFHRA